MDKIETKSKFKGKVLMIQGTASHVGKSLVVAGLCRLFNNLGYRVAPFKSQNMSNNSYITKNGEEIARSQAYQSIAARCEPEVEFNPVLLKPKGNSTSQIIKMGRPYIDTTAEDYYSLHVDSLKEDIIYSLDYLVENYDLIIMEGAGSPAEINLNDKSISNMYVAKITDSPVILVADIDRGGVFASIYGTIKLLNEKERELIRGFIINKFRGNIEILIPGIHQIEVLINKPSLGVIPYIENFKVSSEDSLSLNEHESDGELNIAVIRLPRISNFTDFDPLSWEPTLNVYYTKDPEDLENADVIIIPGSKNTIQDLLWLEKRGFASQIVRLAKRNKLIIGICAGYQILGSEIADNAIEDTMKRVYTGLDLLPINCIFQKYTKTTVQVKGKIENFPFFKDLKVDGYEIHMGEIKIKQNDSAFLYRDNNSAIIGSRNEGGTVLGFLLHGFWDNDEVRHRFIEYVYKKTGKIRKISNSISYQQTLDSNINRMANLLKEHLDIPKLMKFIENGGDLDK
ncbi:MAG: Cobyric acid synthase [Candidatus Heimdallarchaeota archaeon LC_2]|nr:MAG: Cobyric acid synthase [Candidatus Heimdallarchaeota archaeon LC_2]